MGKQRENDGEVFEGDFDQLRDSSWLCSADIPWDKDTVVQIKEVRRHRNLQLRDDMKELAGTLHFVGKKKSLLLNAGHRAVLKALYRDAKGVQGQWVSLYVDPEVRSFGGIVSAVRIRARRPAVPAATGKAHPVPDHDAIVPLSEDEMAANDAKKDAAL